MNARNDLLFDKIELRHPLPTDGDDLDRLLASTPLLDGNSVQCTLLQCSHFAKTSVAAFVDNDLVGFVSAYCPPSEPHTLFVWQVVVAPHWREHGLGKHMLHWLVDQPYSVHCTRMVTAIAIKNTVSWSLFDSFARDIGAIPIKSFVTPMIRNQHRPPKEYLLRIAPLPNCPELVGDHLEDLRANPSHVPAMRRWLD
ncbi:GNAT family N-acetyltransferase [Cellvibrio mixtus]|uniref:GNAT family N-acetyltransferase n=1 Tax=Cellvibrio mixtus TaxID=39650 RepID=UPI0005879A24|nr:GNAT family N-acetyltransferase [Cellvibrio mixtus]